MIESITHSILVGFGLYSLLRLIPFLKLKWIKLDWDKVDELAWNLFSIGGILFLTVWFYDIFKMFTSTDTAYIGVREQFMDREIGSLQYWSTPLVYLFATQIFWFKQLRKISWVRNIVSVFMVLSVKSLLAHLFSLSRGYYLDGWSIDKGLLLQQWLTDLVVFTMLLALVYSIQLRILKKNITNK